MFNDPTNRNALGPLILRVALGVIFLYHGVDKIVGPNSDLGAAWATNLYMKQNILPADLPEMMARIPGESEETKNTIRDKLALEYNREKGLMPEALNNAGVQLAVAWGEVGCGLLLLLGALTRLAALGMIVVQLGAIFMVTYARGFSTFGGAFASGYEYNVALVAMCLCLAVTGAGTLSVDGWWWKARHHKHHAAPTEPVGV
jgi:uncharacterized membrane protein YphA (DoxX/SURF4 family)